MSNIWETISNRLAVARTSPRPTQTNCIGFACYLLGIPSPNIPEFYRDTGPIPCLEPFFSPRLTQIVSQYESALEALSPEDVLIGIGPSIRNIHPYTLLHMSVRHPDIDQRNRETLVERPCFNGDIISISLRDMVDSYRQESWSIPVYYYSLRTYS